MGQCLLWLFRVLYSRATGKESLLLLLLLRERDLLRTSSMKR